MLLTNICHNYHGCYGNILIARVKMVAMGDTIFRNLYFQNFLGFFPLGH